MIHDELISDIIRTYYQKEYIQSIGELVDTQYPNIKTMDDLIAEINKNHGSYDAEDYIHTLDVALIIGVLGRDKPVYSFEGLHYSDAMLLIARVIFPNDQLETIVYDGYCFIKNRNNKTTFNDSHIETLIQHTKDMHVFDIQYILMYLCTENECFIDFVIDQALNNIQNDQPQYLLSLIKWFMPNRTYVSMHQMEDISDDLANKLMNAELDILKTINRYEPSILGLTEPIDEKWLNDALQTSKILNIDINQFLREKNQSDNINEITLD